jgi:hypothetical protein
VGGCSPAPLDRDRICSVFCGNDGARRTDRADEGMAREVLLSYSMACTRRRTWFAALCLLIVTSLLSAHCATPNYGDDLELIDPASPNKTKQEKDEVPMTPTVDPAIPTDTEDPAGATCTHECTTEGAKRCASTSNAATEICAKASDGCRKWTPGADCQADFTCNKTKNDGSCQAGCASDPGCSSGNAGSARCTTDGKTELTCTKVGACYVFKTTRTNVPQQCMSPLYCGPTSGRRLSCVASAAGACTQHVATYNDCPAGTACQGAGQCVSTCTNDAGCSASNLYSEKCTGTRSRLTCAKSGACYKWLATTACSPDETCSAGNCINAPPSCTNACTKFATRCVVGSARSTQICVTGASGCTVWAAGTACSPDETCSNGVCN